MWGNLHGTPASYSLGKQLSESLHKVKIYFFGSSLDKVKGQKFHGILFGQEWATVSAITVPLRITVSDYN